MTWLPRTERIPLEDAGGFVASPGARKILLHTTQGSTIEGAVAAYRARRSAPHLTVDPARRRIAQHIALDRAARALKNLAGGTQTNRDLVWQVEIVGHAELAHLWSHADLDWLGTTVLGPLARATATPLRSTVTFHGAGAGWTLATPTARQRLTAGQWDTYGGVLGHQHAPENDHWDPGALDITRILTAATGHPNGANMTDIAKRLERIELHLINQAARLERIEDQGQDRAATLGDVRKTLRGMYLGNYGEKPGYPQGDLSWLDHRLDPISRRLDQLIERG